MKREIKFRGKSKDTQLWEYGNLLHKRRTNSKATEIYESYYIQRVNFHLELEVIPESIGQFTGFYDKNGKDIYEVDILKSNYKDYMYWVVFENGGFYLYLPKEASICFISNRYNRYNSMERAFEIFKDINIEIEAIGNIHENPELLEK